MPIQVWFRPQRTTKEHYHTQTLVINGLASQSFRWISSFWFETIKVMKLALILPILFAFHLSFAKRSTEVPTSQKEKAETTQNAGGSYLMFLIDCLERSHVLGCRSEWKSRKAQLEENEFRDLRQALVSKYKSEKRAKMRKKIKGLIEAFDSDHPASLQKAEDHTISPAEI